MTRGDMHVSDEKIELAFGGWNTRFDVDPFANMRSIKDI